MISRASASASASATATATAAFVAAAFGAAAFGAATATACAHCGRLNKRASERASESFGGRRRPHQHLTCDPLR